MNHQPPTKYFLGCPVWACKHWKGGLYASRSARDDWLDQYSSVFNTVEGNSTFYGLPDDKTVIRWCDQTRDGFRFALKFPRELTHEHRLVGGADVLERFLHILQILKERDRLGPSLLQLSPNFDGQRLPALLKFFDRIPSGLPIAVEVRHHDYFDQGQIEQTFERALRDRNLDRALFDSRPLFSADPDDEIEIASQSRKPRSPYRESALGPYPMLRLIGRNNLDRITTWVDQWSGIVTSWIEAGKQPYVFTHTPDDQFAPEMAAMFHRALQRQLPEMPDLSPWPGKNEVKQMKLF